MYDVAISKFLHLLRAIIKKSRKKRQNKNDRNIEEAFGYLHVYKKVKESLKQKSFTEAENLHFCAAIAKARIYQNSARENAG